MSHHVQQINWPWLFREEFDQNRECGRAANASEFIVNFSILQPILCVYNCNGKSTIFTLANYLTYYAVCYANFAASVFTIPTLVQGFH